MPLIRPGGTIAWSLTPPATTFPADLDTPPPSFSPTTTMGEKGEKTGQTNAEYTLSILERYLTTFDTFESSSSVSRDLKKENNGSGGGGVDAETSFFSEALERLSEHVTGDANGMAACLICLEDVKPTDPIWHCSGVSSVNSSGGGANDDDANISTSGCYALLHLPCAQAWARQQIQQQQQKQQKSQYSNCWGCPKCRKLYSTVPTLYSCFCGKEENPVFNPWHVAHSCGEECGVQNPLCGHPCMLLCHPGPHPPCPRVVQTACYCGKEKTSRRCGKQEYSCNSICGKKRIRNRELGDGEDSKTVCDHPCPAICHPGECPLCIRLVTASCRCGKTAAQEMQCNAVAAFRCEIICQKMLSCGKHQCTRICCDGNCGPCPFSIGIKTCPCGKTEARDVECGVSVSPCGQTCDKLLACGVHHCTERCHTGPCPKKCRTTVEKTCQCGRMTRAVLCQETFKCERRCTEMKSCGRHPCKRRCCEGSPNCPPCEEVCNRRLRCGNHRCPAPCHSGECSPCPLSIKISCACGKTSYHTPCGREFTAQPPKCQHACCVPATCRHRKAAGFPPHRCHFGSCPGIPGVPRCPFPCGAALQCGHTCSVPCHDPPLPLDIAPFTPPPAPIAPGERDVSRKRIEQLNAPPAALPAMHAAMAFLQEEEKTTTTTTSVGSISTSALCPPCGVMLKISCFGAHSTVSFPCSRASPFSCDKKCGKLLACENHSCSLPCHDIATNPCVQCTLSCQKPRPCKHTCPHTGGSSSGGGKCHPGECGDCQVEVLVPCHCGKTSLSFPCYRTTALTSTTTGSSTQVIKSVELCCTKQCLKQLARCPHLCEAACHQGPCPGSNGRCEAETTVRCSCKRLKKKLPCFEVAALLEKQRKDSGSGGGVDGKYDAMTSLRLLPCDEECAKSTTTKGVSNEKDSNVSSQATITKTKTAGPTASSLAPSLRLEGQKKRLLQDERAAEAARKERDRELKQREKIKQQKIQQLIRFLMLFGLFVFVFGGAFLLRRVLSTVDKAARETWGAEI